MTKHHGHLYAFGPFLLDSGQRLLLRDGQPVPLPPKLIDTLVPLVRNAGRLVGKDELMGEVWPDAFVEEANLSKNIFLLRQVLGEGAGGREYIETLPKRGYRFVASVRCEQPPAADAHTRLRPSWPRVAVLFTTVLAAALVWLWLTRSPQPAVLKTTQITHFGRVDPVSRLVTDGMRIYFVERKGGRLTLAAVPVSGGEPVPVPTPFSRIALYAISPDHSELLVGSDADNNDEASLWTLPAAGGSPRRLGNIVAHDAAWSRDGQKIAYFSGSELYLANPDGSDPRKLAAVSGRTVFSRWSPNGHFLRFSLWSYPLFDLSLWEVGADGGGLHRLLARWQGLPVYYGDGESGGDWTPDGRYFVFRSTRGGFASIWAMREGGGFGVRPARAPVQLFTTDSSLWGGMLAVNNKIFYTGDKEVRELARYDAGSKTFVPCLAGVRARDVSFSPDGRWVAYVVPTMQQGILWKSKADGTDPQQLTFPPLMVGDPQWSPDGTQIAVRGGRTAPGRILLVPSAGGEPEPVTSFYSLYPAWSPDGGRLFFTAPVPLPGGQGGPQTAGEPDEGTYQLDLKTRRISPLPGAEALKALSCSPDGRYQVAETRDNHSLMLFDVGSRRWSQLVRGGVLRAGLWSRDGKYVYFQDFQDASQHVFRVRISDRRIERVAALEQIPRADVRNYFLAGLAPDGSLVVSLIVGHSDIYALDVNLP